MYCRDANPLSNTLFAYISFHLEAHKLLCNLSYEPDMAWQLAGCAGENLGRQSEATKAAI